jgi:hypothetical protein
MTNLPMLVNPTLAKTINLRSSPALYSCCGSRRANSLSSALRAFADHCRRLLERRKRLLRVEEIDQRSNAWEAILQTARGDGARGGG